MKMKDWHYNVLFMLAVVGALAMLFGPKIGLEVRPEVAGIFGLIMAFILKQKDDAGDDDEPKTKTKRKTPSSGTESGDDLNEETN